MSQIVYNFSDERYVVTGASSGIGRQVALDLANAGATVLGIGRNEERLQSLKAEAPSRIVTTSLDVCDSKTLEAAVAEFVFAYGKLNGGVHAAGVGVFTSLRDYDRQTADDIMNTSFWAGINLLQLVTRAKYGERGTSTVLFSSVNALSHEKGAFAYAAAKSAINAAIGSAAKEICGKQHRVNSILPGWVITPMTNSGKETTDMNAVASRHLLGFGTPRDVSNAVLFLLSDAARWVTGSNFVVDGGYLS